MALDFRHKRIKSITNNEDSDLSIAKIRWKMLARVISYYCSIFLGSILLLECNVYNKYLHNFYNIFKKLSIYNLIAILINLYFLLIHSSQDYLAERI